MAFSDLKQKWDKYTEGYLGIVIYIILGFVLAMAMNQGLGFILHTDTPVVAVFSNSMVPTFYKGDMIIVSGSDNYQIGDIVVYETPNFAYPIIHRIISVSNGEIQTKGDNNIVKDPWSTPLNRIHGKAVLKIPMLGWVKIMFSQVVQ